MSELALFSNGLDVTDFLPFVHSVKAYNGGGVLSFMFPNDYEVSVIRHRGSYGGQSGLFEVAFYVDNKMVKVEGISADHDAIVGWLSADEVTAILGKVRNLPVRG